MFYFHSTVVAIFTFSRSRLFGPSRLFGLWQQAVAEVLDQKVSDIYHKTLQQQTWIVNLLKFILDLKTTPATTTTTSTTTTTTPCPSNNDRYKIIQNKCFYFEEALINFESAKAKCKQKGGKLYEPQDVEKMKEIAAIADDYHGGNYWVWIGITDIDEEDTYVYDSNSLSINFTPTWITNYGRCGTSCNCICTPTKGSKFGKLSDVKCSELRSSICQLQEVDENNCTSNNR